MPALQGKHGRDATEVAIRESAKPSIAFGHGMPCPY
jgi:hypothetical protein